MRFKDTELKEVLAAVEEDLQSAYEATKVGHLAKGDDEKSPPGAPESAPEEPSASPDVSASAAPPSPSPSPAPDAGPPAPGPEAAPQADSAPQDPAAEQGAQLTPEALQAEYSQLAPEELDMHIQAALSAKEALAASAAPGPGAPPPAAPPPAAPPAPQASPPAMKAELKINKEANGGVIKSETDPKVAELESLVKSQTQDIENLTKAITLVMERPERKAVTSIAYLSKTETPVPSKEFTPTEAREKLKEMIPTLNKSERALVLGFFEGRVTADKLTPILDKAK